MDNINTILVLAPHTDDSELGCGGTLAKFAREGRNVFCAAFSSAELSLPEGLPKDTLKREIREAVNILGLEEKKLTLFNYPVRNFLENRQAILEDLISLRKKINPDLVIMPSLFDVHQDHQVLSQEGLRAFKGASVSILGYELPWNNLTFETGAFSVLEEKDLDKKLAALSCYKSQGKKFYFTKEFTISLAKVRGAQAGAGGFAEAFQAIKWTIH